RDDRVGEGLSPNFLVDERVDEQRCTWKLKPDARPGEALDTQRRGGGRGGRNRGAQRGDDAAGDQVPAADEELAHGEQSSEQIEADEPHADLCTRPVAAAGTEMQICSGAIAFPALDHLALDDEHIFALFVMLIDAWPLAAGFHLDDPDTYALARRQVAAETARTHKDRRAAFECDGGQSPGLNHDDSPIRPSAIGSIAPSLYYRSTNSCVSGSQLYGDPTGERSVMIDIPSSDAVIAVIESARAGSMAAAATELGVTHGAISRRIQHVEHWLG